MPLGMDLSKAMDNYDGYDMLKGPVLFMEKHGLLLNHVYYVLYK